MSILCKVRKLHSNPLLGAPLSEFDFDDGILPKEAMSSGLEEPPPLAGGRFTIMTRNTFYLNKGCLLSHHTTSWVDGCRGWSSHHCLPGDHTLGKAGLRYVSQKRMIHGYDISIWKKMKVLQL